MIKLHLGCGAVRMRGWVNMDLENWSGKCDLVMDARNLHMYLNRSVDEIFNHALLEHLPPWDTLPTLREWWRVLKRGGVLRTEVPDLERIFEEWLVEGRMDERVALNNIFGGNKSPDRPFAATQHHLTGFTFARLSRLLEEAGFEGCERYEHEKYRVILCVRCVKPGGAA